MDSGFSLLGNTESIEPLMNSLLELLCKDIHEKYKDRIL